MILVTGATGSIGGFLVRDLRRAGVPFRAMVRDEAKGRALGCAFVVGDFDDPGSVARAMEGADRLFLNAGGAVPVPGEQPMVRQQKTAVDAAVKAGVSKVVKVSVWNARPGGRLAEGAHWEIEEYLKAAGPAWAILQPSGFMQNFVTGAGAFTAGGGLVNAYGDARVSYIDCRDIAACGAALLTGDGVGTHVLTGPQGLTGAEIARALSSALGEPVGLVDLTPAELAAALREQGLPESFADDLRVLSEQVAAGSLAATTPAVEDLTGRAARSFEHFLADETEALRAGFLAARAQSGGQ
ncbi:NmrA family NAD(P)-binding protein [Actinocorallia longicatena]|uniref:SDR family oxidoreductase n=1 Tax=Actinocorallia longicatena TaxID=111803 RepID=A0ABP6Q755_9ACTN